MVRNCNSWGSSVVGSCSLSSSLSDSTELVVGRAEELVWDLESSWFCSYGKTRPCRRGDPWLSYPRSLELGPAQGPVCAAQGLHPPSHQSHPPTQPLSHCPRAPIGRVTVNLQMCNPFSSYKLRAKQQLVLLLAESTLVKER